MGKKRNHNCRMTAEEKRIHKTAVRLKRMTDAQLCDFINKTYGRGMEDGAKHVKSPVSVETQSGAEYVKTFIEWLTERIGSGNRIGKGTVLQLNRELEKAEKDGLFKLERAK